MAAPPNQAAARPQKGRTSAVLAEQTHRPSGAFFRIGHTRRNRAGLFHKAFASQVVSQARPESLGLWHGHRPRRPRAANSVLLRFSAISAHQNRPQSSSHRSRFTRRIGSNSPRKNPGSDETASVFRENFPIGASRHSAHLRRTRQTLLPPNPLLFFRTARGADRTVFRGRFRPSHAGSGLSRLAAPGMKPWAMAMAQKAVSITPEQERECPVSAFVLLTYGCAPASVKTERSARASEASPAGVDVAWAATHIARS